MSNYWDVFGFFVQNQSLLLPRMPVSSKSRQNQTLRLQKEKPRCKKTVAAPSYTSVQNTCLFPAADINSLQFWLVRSGCGSVLRSYTTVLREDVQSAGRGAGAWPSVGVSGPTRRVLLSMESSLSWDNGTQTGAGAGELGSSASSPLPREFIWLGTTETPLCPGGNNEERRGDDQRSTRAQTIKHALQKH